MRSRRALIDRSAATISGLRNAPSPLHVTYRLDRYGAGCRMDYRASDPQAIAEAIVATIDRPVAYRPVTRDGAARAARLLAELF